MLNFFVSVPHSGEEVPGEAYWLKDLPETVLMCDVDRYVDRLYRPVIEQNNISHVFAKTHRYVVDLNRLPEDVDESSVEGSSNPKGSFPIGLHWTRTTQGAPLISQPLSQSLHQDLLQKYFFTWHQKVKSLYGELFKQGYKNVYQLDAHSMPSRGTEVHKDPGQYRAEIVVSDQHGKSCSSEFKDLVVGAYKKAGFEVAYNFPYVGGRVTQTYGEPSKGQHCIQVELNRDLYMDEESKQIKPQESQAVQKKIATAIEAIVQGVGELVK